MAQAPILICKCEHLKELHTDEGCILCKMQGKTCSHFVQAGEMMFLTGIEELTKPTTIH